VVLVGSFGTISPPFATTINQKFSPGPVQNAYVQGTIDVGIRFANQVNGFEAIA
jgi:hypothetical protein